MAFVIYRIEPSLKMWYRVRVRPVVEMRLKWCVGLGKRVQERDSYSSTCLRLRLYIMDIINNMQLVACTCNANATEETVYH